MNITDPKLSCTSEVGAHILMLCISFIIVGIATILIFSDMLLMYGIRIRYKSMSDHNTNLFLSLAYTLALPLMSYLFSQSEENNLDSKSQLILIWMVLIEIIRICSDPIYPWFLWKWAVQFVRLFWVSFLVYSYTSIQKLRVPLFILCFYFAVYEGIKVIAFHKAKNSYLIGRNPKLIHNYVKRINLEDEFQTTPMNSCAYIVMGEENHEIAVCSNGFVLGEKKSNSQGKLTIGDVFQLNSSEDGALRRYWHDSCLSLALAKLLRLRFAKLPVDEAGCKKALDFVLEGLIGYIGTNEDIPADRNEGERKPMERVFSIIREELNFVSEFLHMKVFIYIYLKWYPLVDMFGMLIMGGLQCYYTFLIGNNKSAFESFGVQEENNHCFLLVLGHGSGVLKVSGIYRFITISLAGASLYLLMRNFTKYQLQFAKMPRRTGPHAQLRAYIRLTKWIQKIRAQGCHGKNKSTRSPVNFSVFDVSILARLPKWIQKIIPRSSPTPTVIHTDAKEAILMSLKNSGGQLTNGETSLKTHEMEHFNWDCPPNGSTTEAILVWHIATMLFYHQKPSPDQINDPHQETAPQHNNNPFKEQKVALTLSSYCLYLVAKLPELLPDEVESTKNMYGSVIKEILALHWCWMPWMGYWVRKARCNNALQVQTMLGQSSLVGKGVKLANDLVNCANDGSPVWRMLAEFWAELMLFIAPSDNVDGHEKILDREELITQLWAILTHAGIVTRPKSTEHQDLESNVVSGD